MKINFILQGVTDIETVRQGIAITTSKLKTIGITLDHQLSDFSGELKSYTGSYVDTAGQTINFTLVDPKTFPTLGDITCLIYDWTKVNPRPSNPANHGKKIQLPMQWYGQYPEVFAQFLLHEICHDLRPDLTHNQSTNPSYSQKPPIDYYLYLLKLYYKPMTSVTITRNKSTTKQTLGKLIANVNGSTFTCQTLELPWLNNAKNISCIPKGTYQVKWTFSPKFMRYTYQVMNVPNRDGIRIHAGNYYYDYKGCIGLGRTLADLNKDGETDITSTIATVKAFEALMNKQTFTLEIK